LMFLIILIILPRTLFLL